MYVIIMHLTLSRKGHDGKPCHSLTRDYSEEVTSLPDNLMSKIDSAAVQFVADEDIKSVLEFMQDHIRAARLIGVA
jgi:hypothetical protein